MIKSTGELAASASGSAEPRSSWSSSDEGTACIRIGQRRSVRSIKEECLNRLVLLGEGHLRLVVHEYVEHYHGERNHQGLENQLLERAPPLADANAEVKRRERVGGLLNYYHREAA